jgi:hypothetical protein
MQSDGRRWLWRVAVAALLFGVGAWPWPVVRVGFSELLSGLGNVCLAPLSLVQGAHLHLEPLPMDAERTADQHVQADTRVVLAEPDGAQMASLGISLRRDAYLPLLIFGVAIVVLPLRWRSRLLCLGIGTTVIIAMALVSVCALVVFLASQQPGVVPEWTAKLSGFVFECWLAPPGNRVIAPLLLAATLGVAAQRRSLASAARALPTESAPAR